MNFKGKTAVIAGDAWGLGHATALMFAREGAHVICIGDNAEMKDARLLHMDGFELPYFHADVTDAAQVRSVADALEKTLDKVVHHGSIDGVLGNPSIAAYSAGKGGLISLTHVMAHDLGKYNIRVNCISSSGPRKSTIAVTPVEKSRVAFTPLRRQGTPQDVAPVVLFLASDAAAFVSGANIVVDGGRTATTQGCYDEE